MNSGWRWDSQLSAVSGAFTVSAYEVSPHSIKGTSMAHHPRAARRAAVVALVGAGALTAIFATNRSAAGPDTVAAAEAAAAGASRPAAAVAAAETGSPERGRHTAVGLLLVHSPTEQPEPGRPVSPLRPDEIAIIQETVARTLAHDSLFVEAVGQPDSRIRATAWFKGFEADPDPMTARRRSLGQNLAVAPVPRSRLVSVAMTTPVGDDARVIVEELGNVLVARVSLDQKNVERRQIELMSKEIKLAQNDLEQEVLVVLRAKEQELAAAGVDPAGTFNEKRAMFQTLTRAEGEVRRWVAGVETQLQELDEAQRDGKVPADVRFAADRDPRTAAALRRLDEADLRLAELSLTLQKDHADVVTARKIREARAAKAEEVREEFVNRAVEARRGEAQNKRLAFNANRTVIVESVARVGADLGRAAEAMADCGRLRLRAKRLQDRIDALETDVRRVREFRLAVPWSQVEWSSRPTVTP
jgi:hypothetical protein